MPASLNGVQIFGTAVKMNTASEERETQVNSYFGLSGEEHLDGGTRGDLTQVTGLHAGVDLSAFLTAQALIRSYRNGSAYTLVDTAGVSWSNVKLIRFQPTGQRYVSTNGVVFQTYSATLKHLG